ncbi:Major Facilitator Superfamily protein [Advenella kashmirensis WT001]|uniref:Major Facilitator Superfamily protein n=1 Tax=Advenella kashmirensis (strain DSM 17095 / LMG 22695 / WT001) TaxID=1036672 RepID=I3UBB2_ADVKW|nr:Major Facilitator Superfamily protein [Advenella kashmirensis WT001]
MAADFSITHAAVGGVITFTQIGCALALLLLVPLGDQMDRRRLVRLQLVALFVALLGVGLAWSTTALMSGMLMVGMLGTAMTQGLIAYAATAAAPGERGRVVGATQSGVVIGLLSARALAGVVADLASWRGVYFFSALLMLVLGLMLLRALPAQAAPVRRLSYGQLMLSMLTLLRQERVLQIRGMIALLMFAAFSVFWSALVLPLSAPPYSFSHTAIGAFGLVGVVGALGAARAGHWADRGFAQRASGLALILLLVSWLPLSLISHSLWWLIIGIIALDLGGQAIHVTNQSMLFNTQVQAHSRLVGCYMLFYSVGSGLGAIAATAVYAEFGWQGVCWLGAGMSGVALAFWALTLRYMPDNASACARRPPHSCAAI